MDGALIPTHSQIPLVCSQVNFLLPSLSQRLCAAHHTPACLLPQVPGLPEYHLKSFQEHSPNAHMMLSDCIVPESIRLKTINVLRIYQT